MKLKACIYALILVVWIPCLSFSEEKIVSVATLDDYSPYCFPVANKQTTFKDTIPPGSDSSVLQGYSWDILRESFHEMGYTIKLNVSPWARAMNEVKAGGVDLLFPAGKNSEREKVFVYSKEPVNKVNFLVYIRQDSHLKWTGIQSLNALSIGVMRGWNYGEAFNRDTAFNRIEINKISQGFQMLESLRIYGFAGYEIVFDYALKQANQNGVFKKLPTFDSTSEYVVGLKTNQQAKKFIKDFDLGKKQLVKNGKFDAITQKWR